MRKQGNILRDPQYPTSTTSTVEFTTLYNYLLTETAAREEGDLNLTNALAIEVQARIDGDLNADHVTTGNMDGGTAADPVMDGGSPTAEYLPYNSARFLLDGGVVYPTLNGGAA